MNVEHMGFISASKLGVKPEFGQNTQNTSFLIHRNRRITYTRKGPRFPAGTIGLEDPVLSMGTLRHRQRQRSHPGLFGIPEYPITSPELGTKGFIDIYHKPPFPFNIIFPSYPEEIKTVDSEYLQNMSAPKETAISQLNYYMYATGSESGKITYLARDKPELEKQFDLNFQPGRLISDVTRARYGQMYQSMEESYIQALQNPIGLHSNAIGHTRRGPMRDRSTYSRGPIASRAY